MSATMRALVARRYGPASELRVEEVPVPEPGPGQIQVRVAAAAVNTADVRSLSGAMHPVAPLTFPHIVGLEAAGTVTATGPGVTRFAVGDEVFGLAFPRSTAALAERIASPPPLTTGTMAEYTVLEADTPATALRPAGLAVEHASSLAMAGLTALSVLRVAEWEPGATVLVIGAAGGVGSALVPMLATAKVHVVATALPEDRRYLEDLGAAETVGYRSADTVSETLRRHPGGVDALVNLALPGDALPAAARVLRPGGRLLNVASPDVDTGTLGRDDVTIGNIITTARPGDLEGLAADAAAGILPPAVGARYRLSDGARPYVEHGDLHTRGKRVVIVGETARERPAATPRAMGRPVALERDARTEQDPHAMIMDLLHAPLVTQSLAAVAELGVADALAGGPRTVGELASVLGVRPDPLYRVMRLLVAAGVFQRVAPRTFALNPAAETLRTDADRSLRDWARLWALPERQAAITGLVHSIRTGHPSFEALHGTTWWAHLKEHPDQAALFGAAMGDLARNLHAAAVETFDLSGVRCLVDVGGGEGHLVTTILRRHPEMTAVVYDRPEIVPAASAALADAGLAGRARAVAGDFFREVPGGGEVYLLSMILHDWADDQCVDILRVIRRVLPPRGRVLVVDAIVPEDDTPHDGKLRDILMLTLHPGRERTEAEFAALFERAGLRHVETRAVTGSTGLLVAVPAHAEPEKTRS